MANTLTLRNTLNWCAAFLEQQPVLINGMEPALSSANLVLQTTLGPPFAWPFNRSVLNFVSTGQDYVAGGLNDFGFLEGGSVAPPAGNPFEVAVRGVLQLEGNTARPNFVSELTDDGAGNITFRLNPTPAVESSVTLLYQKKAPIMQSMAYTWFPFPDEKNYVPQWGFLSLMSLITNDARFNAYNQKFITSLLAQHGGLTALERNIFLANWTAVLKEVQSAQLGTAERFKAREV
jgi:hypothetical protein